VFRTLYICRDREARRRDRPPHKVLSNDVLFHLSRDPGCDLSKLAGLPHRTQPEFLARLCKAVDAGVKSGPLIGNNNHSPMPPREQRRIRDNLKKLKEWRVRTAEPYLLDPPLIWPTKHLELLARNPKAWGFTAYDDFGRPVVRQWQSSLFAADLERVTRGLIPAMEGASAADLSNEAP